MKSYTQLIKEQPVLFECFFAFSNQQFDEGVKEQHLEGKKILSGGSGLYGTREGIQKLFEFYENQDKKIAETIHPQEVYYYEFNNHECDYTNDDTDAIQIVERIFGKEKAKTVRRRFAYYVIE